MAYEIEVKRTGADSGTLEFTHDGVSVISKCFWDAENRISSGIYSNCSATRMTTKKDSVTGQNRPGVYLPAATSPKTGANDIFIHEGPDPSWSDGCIVLPRDQMMRIWKAVDPKDGRNVTVQVTGI